MNENHGEVFKEEAAELLVELEDSLLELEETPDDKEIIGKIFRAMHTIKGSGAMFGFDDVAAFTHEIETIYDKVRSNELVVTRELIDLTLRARDLIKAMLDSSCEVPQKSELQETVDAFKRLCAPFGISADHCRETSSNPASAAPPSNNKAGDDQSVTYRLRVKPSADLFVTGTNPLLLLDELRTMGECEVTAQLDAIPDLDEIDPERCYTSWDLILTTDQGINGIRDVFIFVEDQCEIRIDVIEKETESDNKRLGEILVERGDITHRELQDVLSEKKYIGEMLVEKGVVSAEKIESALTEQQHIKKLRDRAQTKDEGISSIRVPAEKLDLLVNLVGELVTVQARLTQVASTVQDGELVSVSEEVERLTAELRDNTLNVRMLPIGSTFGRFKRLIRDLSQGLGKEIEMKTDGADTELDKTVIERLNDPLVHLIRNSIDHGIELPEQRLALGKPKTGVIHLSAVHSGASVIIEIKDDGKGLDRDAILAKALEKGLASPNVDLTDRDIFSFIFAPGFSTAKAVTNVSGRGVGMDVVRKAIDALRGTIDITSEKGRGTAVTIKLPLTLAIVDGLLVEIAENRFVLPLSIVEECVELTREDVDRSHGRNIANIRGQIVPYVKLRNEFGIAGEPPAIEQIVITGVNGERVGFVVDSVIGEHQTVIKNLGKFYKDVDTISGATILGDGSVALILDALKLVKNLQAAEATAS